MEPRRLRYFILAAEELNLHTVAERLQVSQPAVGEQIRLLEAELGLDLFVRQKQRIVSLTAAGACYLTHARRAIFEIENASRCAQEIARGKSGVLRVGICEEVATNPGLSVLGNARTAMPTIAFNIVQLASLDLGDALLRSQIDVALGLFPTQTKGVIVEPLWREPWVVVMANDHPLAGRLELCCEDLAHEPLVLGDPKVGAGGHELVRAAFSHAGIAPTVAVEAVRRSTMLTLAASGLGVTFMPQFLRSVGLSELAMVPFTGEFMTVAAAYREGPSATVRRFVDLAQTSHVNPD